MKSKDTPIRFNGEMLEKETELAKLIGVEGAYGEVPAVVRFSINYTLSGLKKDYKFLPSLNATELEVWFSSIKKLLAQEKVMEKIENIKKEG